MRRRRTCNLTRAGRPAAQADAPCKAGIAGRWRRPRWHLARDDCENVRRPGVSGLRAITASTNRDTGNTIECLLVMVVVDSLQAVDRIAPACSPVDPAVEDRPRTASTRACAWPRMHAPAPGRADARFRPAAGARRLASGTPASHPNAKAAGRLLKIDSARSLQAAPRKPPLRRSRGPDGTGRRRRMIAFDGKESPDRVRRGDRFARNAIARRPATETIAFSRATARGALSH
jgi:hypothetical protein